MPGTALIVIDMLNPYEHEDAEPLAASVREQLPQIEALLDRAGDDTLTVYVNDNHDAWEAGAGHTRAKPVGRSSCSARWPAATRSSWSRWHRARTARS